MQKPIFNIEKPEYGNGIIPLVDHEATAVDDRYIVVIGGESTLPSGFNLYSI